MQNNFLKSKKNLIPLIIIYGDLYITNQLKTNSKKSSNLPKSTEISEKLSQDLKKRGFNFVGPTICYALMQAVGMVNDHTSDCFMYQR